MSVARIPCPVCGSDLANPLIQIEEGRCRSCGEDFDPQRFAVDLKVQAAAADGDEDQSQ